MVFEVDPPTLYKKLYEWTQQYGDVFQFRMLGKTFVSINSVEVLRVTFLQEPCATISASRPPNFFGKYFFRNYTDLILASQSASWEKRRKFVHHLLHVYREGKTSLENQVMQNLSYFKENVRKTISNDVNPFEIVDD